MAYSLSNRVLVAVVACVTLSGCYAAPPPPVSACVMFRTCADCACASAHYDVGNDCMPGCAWLPDSATCVAADSVEAQDGDGAAVTNLFPVMPGAPAAHADGVDGAPAHPKAGRTAGSWPGYRFRQTMLAQRYLNCPVGQMPGVATSVAILLGVSCLWLVGAAALVATKWCRAAAHKDHSWVRGLLAEHIPEHDKVLCQGECKPLPPGCADICIGATVVALPTTLPSVYWLAVGLPSEIDDYVSFFLPVWVFGALGILAMVGMALAVCTTRPPLARGYAITDRRVIIVHADIRTRTIGNFGRVKLHNLGRVATVKRAGDAVSFLSWHRRASGGSVAVCCAQSGDPGAAIFESPLGCTKVTLGRLSDTQARDLFDTLRRIADATTPAPCVPAALALARQHGGDSRCGSALDTPIDVGGHGVRRRPAAGGITGAAAASHLCGMGTPAPWVRAGAVGGVPVGVPVAEAEVAPLLHAHVVA